MLFQSWEYLLLLCTVILLLRAVSAIAMRNFIILAASMFFYSYGGSWQTILFLLVILCAYAEGLWMDRYRNPYLLMVFLLILFMPLMVFKYIPFLLYNIGAGKGILNDVVLPVGISFYTFQAAGYVIDVYKGKSQAEKNLLTFACFVSFFPQLIAGPIERSENLIHQLNVPKLASEDDFSCGFRHILLGLALKLLVAETMGEIVNPIYNDLAGKGGLAALIATVCFGIQIYCDFNGYSQIAIGSAKLLGIDLIQNFNHPYRAVSITDFWRRWHISLTTWFRDYVYFPLGGNRMGLTRTLVNTVIIFVLSGIWHGANWTFVMWGLSNGLLMVMEKWIAYYRKVKKITIWNYLSTWILINLMWVFFRANSLQDAMQIYELIFTDTIPQLMSLNSLRGIVHFMLRENNWSSSIYLPALLSMVIYFLYEYGAYFNVGLEEMLCTEKNGKRWIIYLFLLLATLCFGETLQQSAFMYFRF